VKAQASRTPADTVQTMHETAEELEGAEAVLHRSAEASPNETTAERLHVLGDAVTAQAKAIDRRADQLSRSPD
jgi:hypothetical protein